MPLFRVKLVDGSTRDIEARDAAAVRARFAEGEIERVKRVREDGRAVAGRMVASANRATIAACLVVAGLGAISLPARGHTPGPDLMSDGVGLLAAAVIVVLGLAMLALSYQPRRSR